MRIVHLNNKSRKGIYIEVTEGKKRRLLKYEEGTPLDLYKEAIDKDWHWKKVQEEAQKLQHSSRTVHLKRYGERTNNNYKRGHTTIEIGLHELNQKGKIQRIENNFIDRHTANKTFAEQLKKQRHNLGKHYSYQIIIVTDEGKRGIINDIGRRTPRQVHNLWHSQEKIRAGNVLKPDVLAELARKYGLGKQATSQENYKPEMIEYVKVRITFQS